MGCLVLVCYLLSGLSLLGGILGAFVTLGAALIPGLIGCVFWAAIGFALSTVDARSKRTEKLLKQQTQLMHVQTLAKANQPAPPPLPLALEPPRPKAEPPKPKTDIGRNDKYSRDYIEQFSKPELIHSAIAKSVIEDEKKWDFLSIKSAPIPDEEKKLDFSALKSYSIPTVKSQKVMPWGGIALGVAGLFILVVLAALVLPALIPQPTPNPTVSSLTPSATSVDSPSATQASTPEVEVKRAELVTASTPTSTPKLGERRAELVSPASTPTPASTVTFEQADHQLNLAWYALPKSTRHRLLEDQRAWLKNRELLSTEDKIIDTQNRTTYLESLH
jgi:uncharacterized protein YecT (DUF1311 family)